MSEHGCGLECPNCGCKHLPVYYTRHRPGYVMRVRRCRHCGRRMLTKERDRPAPIVPAGQDVADGPPRGEE